MEIIKNTVTFNENQDFNHEIIQLESKITILKTKKFSISKYLLISYLVPLVIIILTSVYFGTRDYGGGLANLQGIGDVFLAIILIIVISSINCLFLTIKFIKINFEKNENICRDKNFFIKFCLVGVLFFYYLE